MTGTQRSFILGLAVAGLAVGLALIVSGCSTQSSSSSQSEGDLVVYSGRKEKLFLPLVEKFEKQTGINIRIKQGGTAELANAILEEQGRPQGDLFVAQDAGILDKLRLEGVLHPYKAKGFDRVAEDFRAADGSWTGVSGRARVLIYNTELVKPEEAPRSVFELTDPKWKSKLAMASSQEASVIAWVSGIRLVKGDDFARDYLKGLLANDIKVLRNHTLVRQAVGKGEFAVGVVNHYYYHLERKDGSPVGVIYPDQEADGLGVLVNTAGVAILNGARNMENAKKFVDFLITPEVQDEFASGNFEYPAIPEVDPFEAKPLDEFKRTPIKLRQLGEMVDGTLDMMSELGVQ